MMKNILLASFLMVMSQITYSQNYQIFFPFNKYDITDKQKVELVGFLQSVHSKNITLFGFADTLGSKQYNKTLAAKRIKTVENILTKNNPQLNIQTVNYGEEKSQSPKDSENRKVEIYLKDEINSSRTPVYKVPQEFTINNTKDTVIKGVDGTELFIPATAFKNEKGGSLTTNMIRIRLTEYYDPAEMIEAKLTTRSNHSILETGGMIYIEAYSNKQKCNLSGDKQIGIKFKNIIPDDSMQLFYGKKDSSGINWELPETIEEKISAITYVEQMPEFKGGENSLLRYISRNAKYPEIAMEQGISGTVYVVCTVNANGYVINPRIARGVAPSLDYEALRVIRTLPRWLPGKLNGRPVSVQMAIPIRFKLDGDKGFKLDSANRIKTYEEMNKLLESDSASITQEEKKYLIIDEFYLWTRKLEWINCDIYYNSGNNRELRIKINSPEEEIYVVFNKNKSILAASMFTPKLAIFRNLPKNEDLTIIGLKISDGKTYFSGLKTKVTDIPIELDYKQIKPGELKEELRKIGL